MTPDTAPTTEAPAAQDERPEPRLFVGSEVGVLRRVLLHRPDTELKRLTPRNKDDLLFDDVLWVKRARQEHDAFADTLAERRVEVLYLDDLLADVLADKDVRTAVLDGTVAAAGPGPRLGPLVWHRSAAIAPYRADGELETAAAAAQRALGDAIGSLSTDVTATSEVVVARASDALIALSRGVDLLVCGSRGYGPVRSVLLGGVTHRLIKEAECPVVVVPRGADQTLGEVPDAREATTR